MGENFGNLIWNWIDSDTQRQRWNLFKQTYWFLSTVLSFSISITDCFESTFLLAMPRTVSWRIFCHWHYYVHWFLLFSTSPLPHWLDKHKEIQNKDSNHWRWFSSTFPGLASAGSAHSLKQLPKMYTGTEKRQQSDQFSFLGNESECSQKINNIDNFTWTSSTSTNAAQSRYSLQNLGISVV